jgi:outer membrane lipoprotein-sorting protein
MKLRMLVISGLFASSMSAYALDAGKLIDIADRVLYPDNFHMKATLVTTTKGEVESSMTLVTDYKRHVGSLMEILAPARTKGMRFLQKEDTLWMWNPRSSTRNAIRLSPKDSFQGSVFSNNDLTEPKYADYYNTTIEGEDTLAVPGLGDSACYILRAEAKSPASPYSLIRMWVTKDGTMPLKVEYYSKAGLLFKEMTLSGLKMLAGRLRPSVVTMRSFERKETISTFTIEELEERNDFPDSMFTQSGLTR